MNKTYSYILLGVNLFVILCAVYGFLRFARFADRQAKIHQMVKPLTVDQINESITKQQDIEHLRRMGTNFGKSMVEEGEINRTTFDFLITEEKKWQYELGVAAGANLMLIGMGMRAFRRNAKNPTPTGIT